MSADVTDDGDRFLAILPLVLQHEGGWSKHPVDPGGATMKGVTLNTYRRFFGEHLGEADLRSISDKELAHIYRAGYWVPVRCDDLPAGVDYAVFDSAVNSGTRNASRWLQTAVGAAQDGVIGPRTLQRVMLIDPQEIVMDVCDIRLRFLRRLSTWDTFGRGWERRVEFVRRKALAMSREDPMPYPDQRMA